MNRPTIVLVLALLLAPVTGLQAQQAGDQTVEEELRALVSQGSEARSDRAAVADFLERDDVERAAAEGGIDLDRLKDGVATLGADEAAGLADRVEDVEDQLAGGDTFVITSTTIIIALLVIILIVVA